MTTLPPPPPAGGRYQNDQGEEAYTIYVFRTSLPTTPVMRAAELDSVATAIRCCPVYFTLKEDTGSGALFAGMDYRMIFAVATKKSVYLYDTTQSAPFAALQHLHFAPLCDLAWCVLLSLSLYISI